MEENGELNLVWQEYSYKSWSKCLHEQIFLGFRCFLGFRTIELIKENEGQYHYFEKGLIEHIQFWAKLSDIQPLSPEELKRIKVQSSVLDIQETLIRSSAGHFIVQESKKNWS